MNRRNFLKYIPFLAAALPALTKVRIEAASEPVESPSLQGIKANDAWSSIKPEPSDLAYNLRIGPDGSLYVGFAPGVSPVRLGEWTWQTWRDLDDDIEDMDTSGTPAIVASLGRDYPT